MPGWHEKTRGRVADGKLTVAGIVQEQHPDRAALFMQWQEMTWPVLADPFNDLGVTAVPITLLIDQHGIIRFRNPKEKDLQEFLSSSYRTEAPKGAVTLLPRSIKPLEELLSREPENARAHFRLGVAYRRRFDSDRRDPDDFARAMVHWQKALELNPNQYIWRRRIQQYGPRLDKPYSFYDWVATAREEVSRRGEKPVALKAEPSGAEFAVPAKKAGGKSVLPDHPDPGNQLVRDQLGLVASKVVVIPSTNPKAKAVRVHLSFIPAKGTTWTNDAGNISFHPAPGSTVEIRDLKLPDLPAELSSAETRVIEFELHPGDGKSLPKRIEGAAFYYVCTASDPTCRFLRQDLVIEIGK